MADLSRSLEVTVECMYGKGEEVLVRTRGGLLEECSSSFFIRP